MGESHLMNPPLPKELARCLMSDGNSRHNKLWLLTGWLTEWSFEWRWQGAPGKSRMLFAFDGGPFKPARSYEEDVLPTLKWIDQ